MYNNAMVRSLKFDYLKVRAKLVTNRILKIIELSSHIVIKWVFWLLLLKLLNTIYVYNTVLSKTY